MINTFMYSVLPKKIKKLVLKKLEYLSWLLVYSLVLVPW